MYVLTVYKQIFSMDFFLISDHGQDLLPYTLQKLQVFAKLNAQLMGKFARKKKRSSKLGASKWIPYPWPIKPPFQFTRP